MEVVKVTQSQTQETGLVVNNDSVARNFFFKDGFEEMNS